MKTCTKCKIEKLEDDFYLKMRHGKRVRVSWCKKCESDYTVQYRRKSPERTLFVAARRRAREKNLPFDLSMSDIIIPKLCPVLGIELKAGIGRGNNLDSSPSINEVVYGLGYTKNNICVMSLKANRMKRDGSLMDLVLLGRWAKQELEKVYD